MPTEVILPKVDMDMATGRITRWFYDEGAIVTKGETLFEIETDKAAMDVEAPASGTLRHISGREGVDIPIGQPVAWIYAEGEADEPAAAALQEQQKSPEEPIAPAAPAPMSVPAESPPAKPPGKIRATPLARRLAESNGIALSLLSGSGPHGRIGKADVLAAVANRAAAPALQAPVTTDDEALLQFGASDSYSLVPHDNMRQTIARRLTEAKQTIPHFYLRTSCRIDALLAMRAEANAAARRITDAEGKAVPAYKISVNDFVIKALAEALMDVPEANVSWAEKYTVQYKHADIGVAVSVPGGLMTPIVRKAEEKKLSAIANEMRDLAARARQRKLRPEEYRGGTIAISNLGMYGVEDFCAIINPPHAAILAVGAAEKRPIIGENDEVTCATMMNVILSIDHRAIDGALGSELLRAFKHRIEHPVGVLV